MTLALSFVISACSTDTPESSQPAAAGSAVIATESVIPSPARDTAEAKTSPASAEPTLHVITPDGWGPLRIGMTRAQVVQAAGEDAHPNAVGGPDPESCDQFRPRDAPEGVLVMIEKGILTRISVTRNTEIATPEGIRVGDRGSAVLAKYGALAREEPHEYADAPARYITVWRPAASKADQRGIRYEINAEDEVTRVNAGGRSIAYVEGCL